MTRVTANGLGFEVLDMGPRDGIPVLMIMGYACQLLHWQPSLVDGLIERGCRVIRFDNRDSGLSEGFDHQGVPTPGVDRPAYTIDDMADDAVGILSALEIGQAHVVGASMGGMIAQSVAGRHSDRVRSLVSIMSTPGDPDLPPASDEAMTALSQPPPDPNDREACVEAHIRFWRIIGSPAYAAGEAELRALAESAIDRAVRPMGSARQLGAILGSPPRGDLLRGVSRPALVIHGEADPLVPIDCGARTASHIKGAKFERVAGLGHDFTRANAHLYERAIGGFVLGVEGG
ncbi:MAG: alpha/beta fold hydrolase [Alphaproteobacteria bacterium]